MLESFLSGIIGIVIGMIFQYFCNKQMLASMHLKYLTELYATKPPEEKARREKYDQFIKWLESETGKHVSQKKQIEKTPNR